MNFHVSYFLKWLGQDFRTKIKSLENFRICQMWLATLWRCTVGKNHCRCSILTKTTVGTYSGFGGNHCSCFTLVPTRPYFFDFASRYFQVGILSRHFPIGIFSEIKMPTLSRHFPHNILEKIPTLSRIFCEYFFRENSDFKSEFLMIFPRKFRVKVWISQFCIFFVRKIPT